MTSDMTSPYRGLTPYTEADAAYFFGRTAEIATITANLEVTRLTLFYGPSGVGKSSVLRAGVMHGLIERSRENVTDFGVAEQIPVYFSQWASDPLLGLSQTLAQTLQPYSVNNEIPAPQADAPLFKQLEGWSDRTASDLLLVLDQFEEYFQYHVPGQGAAWDPTGFGAHLMQIVNHSTLRVNVLLSLRDDALARLDYFQGRIPALYENRLSIGHLDRAAGAEAVTQPLVQFNRDQGTAYRVEEPLTAALLDQVAGGQVGLSRRGSGGRATEQFEQTRPSAERIEAPYLQLVLTRLWQQERENGAITLRLVTLNAQLGGAETIVRNYLDDTLDALPATARDRIARVADHLVTPSGTKIALTLGELAHYAATTLAEVAGLAQQLQDRRLLRGFQSPTGETQYEIFHDVLGPALLDWQERYRKAQAEAERLATAEAEGVEAERRAQEAEERARLQDEARHAAEHLVRAQAKSAKQLRRLIFGLVTILLIAVAAAVFANVQTRLVTGFSLSLEARNFVRNQNLRMATLLALEARQLNPIQGERVLAAEIPLQVSYRRSRTLFSHSAAVRSVAWRPDGQQLASASSDNTILLYPSVYLEPPCTWAWSNLTPDEWLRYRGWAIYRPTCPDYPTAKLPTVLESFDRNPEYLLISWQGRFFVGGLFLLGLLLMVLPIWGLVWLVRRFLRRRRQRRLAGAG